jgi:hypothetical protein
MGRRWGRAIVGLVGFGLAVAMVGTLPAQEASKTASKKEGFKDTPMIPGTPWHVHDSDRPHPKVVTPGTCSTPEKVGTAPSDAIVLFDGSNLDQWRSGDGPAKWKIEDGAMVMVPGTGPLMTRKEFGDCQLHVEFATPKPPKGSGQGRGNSGILLMGRYEIQVLDSYENVTYADGQAAAVYGQYPPLVNASRPPGEWQTYDILFTAPVFDGDKLIKPASETVLHNGVAVHNHVEPIGPMVYRALARYKPHGPKGPLGLQDHGNPLRFRNIWIRELRGYDQPE